MKYSDRPFTVMSLLQGLLPPDEKEKMEDQAAYRVEAPVWPPLPPRVNETFPLKVAARCGWTM